jgi:NAD(P)-dependent dehydrogenase (short-subunit alcohol dehydrogenase family)
MSSKQAVAVYGASGHTGRFVVAELLSRGYQPIVSGRSRTKLEGLAAARGLDVREGSAEDPSSLDRAFAGAAVVVNCAGPFARTAVPVMEAALRARIPYVDVSAEIEVASEAFTQYGDLARNAGTTILPALAFFGGLGDLLATAAMGDWQSADEISIAYGLDSWNPTDGTRATSAVSAQRRDGRRLVFSQGALHYSGDPAPRTEWPFPSPLGLQAVVGEFTMADTVTIAHHLHAPEIRSFMTATAVQDVSRADYSTPAPVDETGRSAQTFLVDVVVRSGDARRRATANGRDIYAITAPLVVEAVDRLLHDSHPAGVFSAGELFDARDFLTSLSPRHLRLQFEPSASCGAGLASP